MAVGWTRNLPWAPRSQNYTGQDKSGDSATARQAYLKCLPREGDTAPPSTELLLFQQATHNSRSELQSGDWNTRREGRNDPQNNRRWPESEEAGGGAAGGSCPEPTEGFRQVSAICSPLLIN